MIDASVGKAEESAAAASQSVKRLPPNRARKLPGSAFSAYVGMGPARTYGKVAIHFGVSKSTVSRHARAQGWADMLSYVESRAREASLEEVQETLEDMSTRHVRALRDIQDKALTYMAKFKPQSFTDAVRALTKALALERDVRVPKHTGNVVIPTNLAHQEARWLDAKSVDAPVKPTNERDELPALTQHAPA